MGGIDILHHNDFIISEIVRQARQVSSYRRRMNAFRGARHLSRGATANRLSRSACGSRRGMMAASSSIDSCSINMACLQFDAREVLLA